MSRSWQVNMILNKTCYTYTKYCTTRRINKIWLGFTHLVVEIVKKW